MMFFWECRIEEHMPTKMGSETDLKNRLGIIKELVECGSLDLIYGLKAALNH